MYLLVSINPMKRPKPTMNSTNRYCLLIQIILILIRINLLLKTTVPSCFRKLLSLIFVSLF